MQTFTVPFQISDILLEWDWLGFDTRSECTNAILQNADWAERWDCLNEAETDIAEVTAWRNETLSQLTEYAF